MIILMMISFDWRVVLKLRSEMKSFIAEQIINRRANRVLTYYLHTTRAQRPDSDKVRQASLLCAKSDQSDTFSTQVLNHYCIQLY